MLKILFFAISLTFAPLSIGQELFEFENGQVADADDINTNFQTLKNAIDSISSEDGATLYAA